MSTTKAVTPHKEQTKFFASSPLRIMTTILGASGALFLLVALISKSLGEIMTKIQGFLIGEGRYSPITFSADGAVYMAIGAFALMAFVLLINHQDVAKDKAVERFHFSNLTIGIGMFAVGIVLAITSTPMTFGLPVNVSMSLGMAGIFMGVLIVAMNAMELNHKVKNVQGNATN